MPRGNGPTKPDVPEEKVDLDGHIDADEIMDEEEVEYEEVEEEVEEYEEEEEEEEDVAKEEDVEDTTAGNGGGSEPNRGNENQMKSDNDGDECERYAELLALPAHGSEIYVGNIPHISSDEELKSFCETVGEVVEVRIMKGKDSAENKGYAFVSYKTKELALKAIMDMNNAEFKGKKVKVSKSQAKNKLFIGNIPRTWTEDDLRNVIAKVGPGILNVELVKDQQNSSRNRGFAFIEYYNQACAEFSRKKMSVAQFKLDSNSPTVTWAEQKNTDNTTQVKAIYVKNLPKDVTQDQLRELFQHHGEITKVMLPPAKSGQENSRYGFVHFAERSTALKVLNGDEKYELDGQVLECSLAKPPTEKKADTSSAMHKLLLPSYPTRGYGVIGPGYGLAANYSVAPFGQPMMHGRGVAPAGVAMVPMILPDGRLGYVLQSPGIPQVQNPQQRGGRGGQGHGSKSGGDNNRGQRYHPY